jgi:hypothetical protein
MVGGKNERQLGRLSETPLGGPEVPRTSEYLLMLAHLLSSANSPVLDLFFHNFPKGMIGNGSPVSQKTRLMIRWVVRSRIVRSRTGGGGMMWLLMR